MTAMWGLLAVFDDHETLVRAARRLREAGYERLDAYTPWAVDEVADAVGVRRTRIGWSVLAGGLLGAGGGYLMQWYLMAVDYPINVGGRPLHSWPAFIPITFELMVLTAAISGVVTLFLRNGLPRPYHPVFAAPSFARASQDRFCLAVEAADPRFSREWTRRLLERLGARTVEEIPDAA
jgi:ActD protein